MHMRHLLPIPALLVALAAAGLSQAATPKSYVYKLSLDKDYLLV